MRGVFTENREKGKMMNSINEMNKCIKCLYITLPASIADDVDNRWQNVSKEIERLKKALRDIESCPRSFLDGKQPVASVMVKIAEKALKEK